MNASILKLSAWLQEHRPDFARKLNAAANPDEMKKLDAQFTVRIPTDFVQYLAWHDGQPFDSPTLYDNRRLMPVADIIDTVQVLNECTDAGEFETDTWWLPTYLPFVSDGGGNYVVLNLNDGSVCEYWKADIDRPVIASSFSEWVKQLVLGFSSKQWILERGACIRASESRPADPYEKVDLIMIKSPNGGLSELKSIYEALALSYGIGRLFSDLKKETVTLFADIYYERACRYVSRVNDGDLFEIHAKENPGQV